MTPEATIGVVVGVVGFVMSALSLWMAKWSTDRTVRSQRASTPSASNAPTVLPEPSVGGAIDNTTSITSAAVRSAYNALSDSFSDVFVSAQTSRESMITTDTSNGE